MSEEKSGAQIDDVAMANKAAQLAIKGPLGLATESEQVKDIIPDAPVSEHSQVPPGWSLQDEGALPALYRLVVQDGAPRRVAIAKNPIVVTGWVSNHTRGTKALEIAWKARSKWRKLIADRSDLLDTGKIIQSIADTGFPVTAINRRDIVRYVAEYVDINLEHIPPIDVSEQMGWQRDGGFLAGEQQIETATIFSGADSGDDQMAQAIREHGELTGWLEAVSPVEDYPIAEMALYAALAPPLLEVLAAPNFAVDWSYQTSSGKTTALRIAASCWGSPDERSGQSMIRSWGGTQIGIERIASMYSGLPLILDDTKRARVVRGESVVARALYTIANGAADMRASKNGIRRTLNWRTVLLSTGEERIIDATKDGGTAARCLCLWGPPMGKTSGKTGGVIAEINRGISEHYGHVGPMLVRWVIEQRDEWPRWRDQLETLRGEILALLRDAGAVDAGVADRMARSIAVLELTSRLFARAVEVPWKRNRPMDVIPVRVVDGAMSADRATEALEHLITWCQTHRSRVWDGNSHEEQTEPSRGWVGRWDTETPMTAKWDALYITRQALSEILGEAGYGVDSAIRLWRDRGWIASDRDRRRLTRRVRLAGDRVHAIAITREAIESISGDD